MAATKTALVTGGTRGIGFLTAQKLCQRGYRVLLTGRSSSSADEAAAQIRRQIPDAAVEGRALDLGSLRAVQAFGRALVESLGALDLLVNNAGVMESHKEVVLSEDGWELMFAANHLGHFLLTRQLLPLLLASAPARVVVVSSRWHAPGSSGPPARFDFENLDGKHGYDPTVFYKNSKLSNLWFTFALARRLAGTAVTVNAVCPGFVPATLAEHQTGVQRLVTKYLLPMLPAAHTPEVAADNTVFVATAPEYATRSGAFVGELKEVEASDDARDEAPAERLWKLSSGLCGLDESIQTPGVANSPMR